jgi:hypothetical protein
MQSKAPNIKTPHQTPVCDVDHAEKSNPGTTPISFLSNHRVRLSGLIKFARFAKPLA